MVQMTDINPYFFNRSVVTLRLFQPDPNYYPVHYSLFNGIWN
jgi:hypothetical protein